MKQWAVIAVTVLMMVAFVGSTLAKPPTKPVKSQFFEFGPHMIDGEVRKPVGTYANARERVKFERLLSLKKSFLRALYDTQKERVFK